MIRLVDNVAMNMLLCGYTLSTDTLDIYIYTQDIANMCGHKLIGLNRRGMHMTQQGQNSFDQSVAKGSTL